MKLTFRNTDRKWTEVYVGEDKLGGFGETTYSSDELRWYWHGAGSFGHCRTREEAIAELSAKAPAFLEMQATIAKEAADLASLPDHLRELKIAVDSAFAEQQMAFGKTPFVTADYLSASSRWFAARLAFDKANDAWRSQREAA